MDLFDELLTGGSTGDEDNSSSLRDLDPRSLVTAKAEEYGVPVNLALALTNQESGFDNKAMSPKGASGLMQLMPGTAADLGVDPTDPVQNVDGGMRYLRQNYDKFGDWEMALAAYHAGPGAVSKAGGIPATNDGLIETRNYVSNIMGRANRLGGITAKQAEGDVLDDLLGIQRKGAAADSGMSRDDFREAVFAEAMKEENVDGPKYGRIPSMVSKGLANAIKGVGWLTGVESLEKWGGEREAAILADQMKDPEVAEALTRFSEAKGLKGALQTFADQPLALADIVLGSAPSMLFSMGAAKGVQIVTNLTMNAAKAAGMSASLTSQAVSNAVTKYGSMAAAAGTEGALTGGAAGSEIEQKLIAQGMSPEAAAERASDFATQIGVATAVLSAFGDARLEAGVATGAGLKDAGVKGVAKNVVAPSVVEGVQESTEAALTGRATGEDPDIGKAFASGMAASLPTSGALHTAGRLQDRAFESGIPILDKEVALQAETVPLQDSKPRDIIKPINIDAYTSAIGNAQSVDEAVATFMDVMSKSELQTSGGVSLDALSRVDQISKVADTDAMRAMLDQLSPEARADFLGAVDTVRSGDPRVPNAARVQATDRVFQQLADTGTLEKAQYEIQQKGLKGTPEEAMAIERGSQFLAKAEFSQLIANQPQNVKAAIDATIAQIGNTSQPESVRAEAATRLTKFAEQAGLQLGQAPAEAKVETPKVDRVAETAKSFETNRAALQAITSSPEWQAHLKSLPSAERSAMVEKVSVVSNPKIAASYRNSVATEIISAAESAGIGVPSTGPALDTGAQTASAPGSAPRGRVQVGDVQGMLARAKFAPEDGVVKLADPNVRRAGAVSDGEARFVQVIGRALGKEVVFFEQEGGTAHRDGFALPENKDVVFLNRMQSGAASLQALAGHEIYHTMPEDLKQAFSAAVAANMKDGSFDAYRNYSGQPGLDSGGVIEEMSADLWGNGFNKPELIKQALDGMPVSTAQKLLSHVRQFIAKMIQALRGQKDFDTKELISDMQAVDRAWVQTFREFVARENAGQGMINGREANTFSMDELAELMADRESPMAEKAEAEIARRSSYANPDATDRLEAAAGISKPTQEIVTADKSLIKPASKTKLQDEIKRIQDKRNKGELLNDRERGLVDMKQEPPKPELEIVERQPKKDNPLRQPEITEEEANADLEAENEEGYEINEEMPIRYSTKREALRQRLEEMSTRVPTTKNGDDAVVNFLVVGLKAMAADKRAFEKNIGIVTGYHNYRPTDSANTPEKQANRFINHVRDNLLWLHDQMAPELRDRAKLWYDGANKIAERLSRAYDISDHQVAGVMAALSPQKDWFQNVSLGQRVIDAMSTKQHFAWSKEMDAEAQRIYASERNRAVYDAIKGKRLGELTNVVEKAAWIRAYDEAHNQRSYSIISPEGDEVGIAKTGSGNPQKVAWGSLNEIAKAVSVIENGSPENISANVGGQHKVRNFYNNILLPNSANGHVTIDTHAVAAGLLRPLSGSSTEVLHNFGTGGIAKAGATGAKGTYGLYAEAYRRAAEARGLLPREMQSITWEAVRGLFKPAFKRNKASISAIDAVWAQFHKGKLTYEEARQQVLQLAGGIDAPSWDGSSYELDEEPGDSADEGELSGAGVSESDATELTGAAGRAGGAVPESGVAYSSERGRILFEVAPDPNNTELTQRWNALDDTSKTRISERVAEQIVPKMLRTIGVKGEMRPQLGGYLGVTNPSFSITLDQSATTSQITRAAKVGGYMLAQDSMMVVTQEPVDGADAVGIITVSLPHDASAELVSDVYRQIYEIEDGVIQGHTTVGGQMAMIDFSGRTQELAELINQKLDGRYNVETHSGFAAFIEKKDYDYGSQAQPTGNEAPAESPIRNTANRLRAEASALLEAELNAAEEGQVSYSSARGQIAPTWQMDEPSKIDDFVYVMQDKNIDLKRAVDAVKAAGRNIVDKFNPRLQETLYHGRTAKQTKDFLDHEMKPLLQSMQAAKVDIAELNEYMHMRHAEERNVAIARINSAMPDGGSGVSTAQARSYLSRLDPAKARTLEALARRVDRITKSTRDLLVSSGLETQDTINEWERTYKHYVPLMREDIGDGSLGVGQGLSVKGSSSKRAMGSNRAVSDILAHVAMMRERTITRAEKARVGLALMGLAIQNPNTDVWMPVIPGQNVQKQQSALVAMGLNPVLASNLVNQPMKRYIDPRTGLVRSMVDNNLGSEANVITTRFQGKDYYLVMNPQNERAQRMAQSLKNLDAQQLGQVLSAASKVTRWFAAINTQYNPIFGILNVTRDTGSAMLNLTTTPIAGQQAAVSANIAPAMRGIWIALRDSRAGKQTRSQWARLWDEFQNAGARTGYRDMFANGAERAEALQKELDALSEGKAKQIGRAMLGVLNDFNDTLENAVRLAAYKVAKEQGMSTDQAAAMAKDLTVNFNRKGQIATQAGALYAFFNASAQGTARLIETMSGPAGMKIAMGGVLLGVVQAAMLAAAGMDDEIPEFVKQRNVVVPTGGGKYVTIPMPLGFNAIPSVARLAAEFVMGGGKDPAKYLGHTVDLLADNFNPIGNAGLSVQTISPTFADPIVALAENKDWTGKPIAKVDRSSLNPTPGHTRAYATASDFGKAVSRGLNWATGGSEYRPGMVSPTPDQIDFLAGQITGGLGREALKVSETVSAMSTGEELPPNKVPLLGRFYGNTNSQATTSTKFYENLTRLNEHEAELKGRKKDGLSTADYLKDNPEAKLVAEANKIEKEISSLRKMKQKLLDSDAPKDRVRAIEQRITSQMERLNKRVESLD